MTIRRLRDTIWRKRLRAIERAWPAAGRGDPEGVHRLRVALRRVHEALPVVSDGRHPRREKRARRKGRSLRRLLGPVRERDVSLALLAHLNERQADHRSAIRLVHQRIQGERQDLGRDLDANLSSVDVEELVRKLSRAVGSTKDADDDVARLARGRWELALATRVVRRARQLEQAVDRAGPLYAPDRLHGVRVRAKKLRYALEFGHEARLWRWASQLRSLKQIQETLGQLQDREALLDRVRASAQATVGLAEESEGLARLSRLLEEEARGFHAEFLRRRVRLLKLCATVRRQATQALPIGRPAPQPLSEAPDPRATEENAHVPVSKH